MQNRGVSELVGFVLVILIVVILMVSVFLFFDVKKYLFNINPCNTKVNIMSVCYNEKNIIVKIENNNDFEINNGFLFKIYGNDEYNVPSPPFTKLNAFEVKEITLPYEKFAGNISKIMILPKIIVDDKQYICDSNLEEYKVHVC